MTWRSAQKFILQQIKLRQKKDCQQHTKEIRTVVLVTSMFS